MWARILASLVITTLAASAPAAAAPVRGYVYVTATKPVPTTHKSQASACWVTVQRPATPITQPPAPGDLGPLAHATRIGVTVSDPFDNCADYLHTWQLATFDPAHPDHVDLDWPTGRPSIFFLLIIATLAILIGGYVLDRRRARRRRATVSASRRG